MNINPTNKAMNFHHPDHMGFSGTFSRSFLVLTGLMLLLFAPISCKTAENGNGFGGGYTTASLFSDQYHSVAVPVFANKTLYTGVERDVTEAVIKAIQSRTPYVVQQGGNADTVLEGTIVSVSKTKLGELRGSGLVEDVLITITVDFTWKDARGKTLTARQNFQSGDVYVPAQPVSERPQIGLWAASQELGNDIVNTMEESW